MLQFSFLTKEFYNDYSKCKQIEKKDLRPYIQVTIDVDGVLFAIPLRSNINHPHVLWTDKANHCGVDFSKAVVITDPARYIDSTKTPYIRPNEFKVLRGKDHQVKEGLKKYIAEYKKTKANPISKRDKDLLHCSALQYFEQYI